MSDLIRRSDAIEALGEEPKIWYDEPSEFGERKQWLRDLRAIEAVPSVESKRKKGTWLFATEFPHGKSCYVCTVCGAKLDSRYTNFCPQCGSDMREGEEDG